MSKKHRISYFDVVGKATGSLRERDIAQAIEALSATYRAGRDDFDHSSPEGRAAYLWHILPAHVCDVSRLLADLGTLSGRRELRLVGLGSGPGTEVLALLETASAARARGELEELELLHATRIEQSAAWDQSFAALLKPLLEQVAQRAPGYGTAWRLQADPQAVVCDLTAPPLPAAASSALAEADLVVAANLFSEVRPRGTDELPAGFTTCLQEVLAALRPPFEIVLLDRAGAPGAAPRLAAFVDLAQAAFGALTVVGPRERTTRCGCAFTRQGKAIYRHVHLPTTKDSDRPVKNCKTLWYHLSAESP